MKSIKKRCLSVTERQLKDRIHLLKTNRLAILKRIDSKIEELEKLIQEERDKITSHGLKVKRGKYNYE